MWRGKHVYQLQAPMLIYIRARGEHNNNKDIHLRRRVAWTHCHLVMQSRLRDGRGSCENSRRFTIWLQMLIIYNAMVCVCVLDVTALFDPISLFMRFLFFFFHEVRSCRVVNGARWRIGCNADAHCVRSWYVTMAASSIHRPIRRCLSTTTGQVSANRANHRREFESVSPVVESADLFSTTALHR